MPWLTEILGHRVLDPEQSTLGRIDDLLAEPGRFPKVTRASVRLGASGRRLLEGSAGLVFVDWRNLSANGSYVVHSETPWQNKSPETELRLSADLLDRQIVDTEGARVVRVNDVWLSDSAGGLRVVGAEVGFGGVLRRLGLGALANRLARALGYEIPEQLIAWNYLAPLEEPKSEVRLTVPSRMLRDLRPSELADIIEELDQERRERILTVMTNTTLAETLPEADPAISIEAVEVLGEERVQQVLLLMPPDEAADLLGVLSYERAERLLSLMGLGEAKVLRELLGYAPDTAGGRMTPSFIAVEATLTAQEAIERIREKALEAEIIYYAYVLDGEGHLTGVLSLRELLRSRASRAVAEIMEIDVVSADLTEDQEEVARKMARYDLLALPVIDEQSRLRGIVTVDDIIEVLDEEASEDLSEVTGVYLGEGPGVPAGRLAGFGLSLVAGAAAAILIESSRPELRSVAPVAWLLPLYLRIAQDVGTWSLARALAGINKPARQRLDLITQELLAALVSAASAGLLVGIFGRIWTGGVAGGVFLGVGIFLGSLVASVMGLALPSVARSLRLTRLLARGRPLAVLVGIATLVIYVWALGSLAARL